KRWESERNANASETHCDGNASHKPLATSHQEAESAKADLSPATAADPPADDSEQGIPPCPHAAIVALYHQHLPMLARVRDWTDARQKLLRARWRENPKRQDLAWWARYFQHVAKSDFLTGRTQPRNGEAPFEADLEWLVRPRNLVKVIE